MLALQLRDSRCLRIVRHALHGVAVAAMFCLPQTLAPGALGASILLLACVWSVRRQHAPLRLLELGTDGRCRAVDQQSAVTTGSLGAGSLAIPGLIVLEIRGASGHRRQVWLPYDAFEGDEQRRLRVRIRVAA
jgi:hypothetical protein